MIGNRSEVLAGTKPKQWTKWLGWGEFWFNTNYNSSWKLTPFKLSTVEIIPPHLLKRTTIPSVVEEVNMLTQERDQILHDLNDNLVKAQIRMKTAQVQLKTYADWSRQLVTLAVNDWVYLNLQPYRLKPLAKKRNEKLSP